MDGATWLAAVPPRAYALTPGTQHLTPSPQTPTPSRYRTSHSCTFQTGLASSAFLVSTFVRRLLNAMGSTS